MRLFCTFAKYIGTCALISGCATAIPPAPIVRTIEVRVPVPVPCRTAIPPLPLWELSRISPDAGLFDMARAIVVELNQRQAYEKLLLAAALACSE